MLVEIGTVFFSQSNFSTMIYDPSCPSYYKALSTSSFDENLTNPYPFETALMALPSLDRVFETLQHTTAPILENIE